HGAAASREPEFSKHIGQGCAVESRLSGRRSFLFAFRIHHSTCLPVRPRSASRPLAADIFVASIHSSLSCPCRRIARARWLDCRAAFNGSGPRRAEELELSRFALAFY